MRVNQCLARERAEELADLEGSDGVHRLHIAEALSYRRINLRQ